MQLIKITDLFNDEIIINPKNICTIKESIFNDWGTFTYCLIINGEEIKLFKKTKGIDSLKEIDEANISLHQQFLKIVKEINRSIYE